ncbi:MAG: cytochrome c oxidase subunit 3, partial [Saprospiraceae bacterium]|nr:cytochrome c oxidase subunit 3 [Saprospiraceae bacterium]
AHIIGGLGALIMALTHAFMLDFFVSEKRKNRFKMVVTYWHFVDLIWLYLFIFFNVQR